MTAVKGKLVNNLRCSSDGGQIMRQLFGECHRELPSVQEGGKNKLSRCEKLLAGFFLFFLIFCRLPTIPEIMISAGQVVCLRVFWVFFRKQPFSKEPWREDLISCRPNEIQTG